MAHASNGRLRLVFGAPLPIGVVGEAEWLDLFLTERMPRWRVREALEPVVPAGWRVRDLADIWLSEPSLTGAVAAADHRISLALGPTAAQVRAAARALLAADRLPRQREKGSGTVPYDLRTLLLDVGVIDDGPPVVVRIRTRIHPTLGTGRPEGARGDG